MKEFASMDALLLEDFDIKNLSEWFPEREIGVHVTQIYSQIAKLNGSVKRREELSILSKVISNIENQKYEQEPKYVAMTAKDIRTCFGKALKKLPKKTFIEIAG